MDLRQLCAFDYTHHIDLWVEVGDIVGDGPGEQLIVLHDYTRGSSPIPHPQGMQGQSIYPNGPGFWFEQSQDHLQQCRLATTRRADDANVFSLINGKRNFF